MTIPLHELSVFPTGIGIATTVIASLCNIYYIVILAWDLFYLTQAFTSVLPWSHCNNTWNTERYVLLLLLLLLLLILLLRLHLLLLLVALKKGYCNSWEHAGSSQGLGKPLPGSVSREVPPGKPLPGTTYLRENLSRELPTSGKTYPGNYLPPGKPLSGTTQEQPPSSGNNLPLPGTRSFPVKEGRSRSRSTPKVVPGQGRLVPGVFLLPSHLFPGIAVTLKKGRKGRN